MQAIKVMNMIKLYGKPIRASQDKKSLDVGANLFVGNLDPDVDEKLFYDTFSAFGVIVTNPKVKLLFSCSRSGTPSSMYMGVPPYGSSLFNGSSTSPYDVPFSGGSAYPYNYGNRLFGGSLYRLLHIAGPTPYSSGSMMGNGTCFSRASYCLLFVILDAEFGNFFITLCHHPESTYMNSGKIGKLFSKVEEVQN
ncbi:uncharacterized protein LOC114282649 [Camellia sinensis]|uniref:uncharacterized protein LOC114282649 n=1 Tax=Camellia sinensis TaxID=4442 RepID=UPI001036B026|nr:uncharacterized protein LOC114282649 [Camellia sinensis]